MTTGAGHVRVLLESEGRHAAATAVDWPGWCRHLRGDTDDALEALAAYAPRYAEVPRRAGLAFDPGTASFDVVERLPGRHTSMGPGARGEVESVPLGEGEGARLASLLAGCWALLDDVLASAPETLRKGPRGGGRDTAAVREHVDSAQGSYGLRVGIRRPAALGPVVVRERLLAVLRGEEAPEAPERNPWPLRYLASKAAWHVTDHAFEVQDRSTAALDALSSGPST